MFNFFKGAPGNRGFPGSDGLPGQKVRNMLNASQPIRFQRLLTMPATSSPLICFLNLMQFHPKPYSPSNPPRVHRVNVVSQAHQGLRVQLETLADLGKLEFREQGLVK